MLKQKGNKMTAAEQAAPDRYDQGYSDGYDGKGYNSPFKIGSNEDDEYEDGYSSGRLDYIKMNREYE